MCRLGAIPLLGVWAIAEVVSDRQFGGKSGLHMAAQGLTTPHRKVRNSGTERMSGALSLNLGTGEFRGVAGVKTAKLCVEQDQIGEQFWRGQR